MILTMFRKGQGEYVATLVILGLMISFSILVLEWQKAIRDTARSVIEQIDKAKETLIVIRNERGLRIINAWNGVSTIAAFIYRFISACSFSEALSSLSREGLIDRVMVFNKSLLIVELLSKDSWIKVPPASSVTIGGSLDPVVSTLNEYASTICVYTINNNVFCNSTTITLTTNANGYSKVLIFNGSLTSISQLAVANYTKALVSAFGYPFNYPLSSLPSYVPLVIAYNFSSIPKYLVATSKYVRIYVNYSCRSIQCAWTPANFTMRIDGKLVKPSYVCLFDTRGVLLGCSDGEEPVVTSLRVFVAIIDGVPVYVDVSSKPYTESASMLVVGGLSNGRYTIAKASVVTVSFRGSKPVAILYTNYSWGLCRLSAWRVWGLCTTYVSYLIVDSSTYVNTISFGYYFNLPLTALNKTTPRLYPPKAPLPPESSKYVLLKVEVPGYAPINVRVYLLNFSNGFGAVPWIQPIIGVFIPFTGMLRVEVPTYTITNPYDGNEITFRIPVYFLNLSNSYRVEGYVSNTFGVGSVYDVNASEYVYELNKLFVGYERTQGYFNMGFNVPISSSYTYLLTVVANSDRMPMPSIALLKWSLSSNYYFVPRPAA